MAFFYVKSGGSATGDAGRHASQQTGSFATLGATNYYNDIQDALAATTPPVANEFILVSDVHDFDSSTTTITYVFTSTTPGVNVVCVDDSNLDAYRTAEGTRGIERVTGGSSADLILNHRASIWGMEFSTVDNIVFGSSSGAPSDINLYDCKFIIPGTTDQLTILNDGSSAKLYDCEIAVNNAGAFIRLGNGNTFYMTGGSVTTTSGGLTSLISGGFQSGGGRIYMNGVDLSSVTGTLVSGSGSSDVGDDAFLCEFINCKIDSGVAFANEDFASQNQQILFRGCASTSAEAEYQFYYRAQSGEVEHEVTIRRADDEAFDSGTRVSYKVITNADATVSAPFYFEFPTTRFAALSAGATDTLRFFVVSTATLTDADISITVLYSDGTNEQDQNLAGNSPSAAWTAVLNPMATGSTLTTDSGSDWRDGGSALTSHNEYQIDISTTGDAGADGIPQVFVSIHKASTTLYFASHYELN